MKGKINWSEVTGPLLKKYKNKKHPLNYETIYQLMVLVVLSAQTNDKLINDISPKLFDAFPDMNSLCRADAEMLYPLISKVIGFRKKADWLLQIAKKIKEDKNIPLTMQGLTSLPGIGRKSANVIMREANVKAEGVIVDLHVLRVAPRIGIAKGEDPKIMELEIIKKIPQKEWGEIGMALSFLGRETCRPKDPLCDECVLNKICVYYSVLKKKAEIINKKKFKK